MMPSGSSSSSILVIGGTGKIGQHLVKASLAAGHPTAVLVRPSTAADPSRLKLLEAFKATGATILHGGMYEHESLLAAFRQVDVVISAVGHRYGPPEQHDDLEDGQLRVMAAIKEAGNVKRFVPSEYGCDVDHAARGAVSVMEPARSMLLSKARVREALRASGIPHTIICSYWAHGLVLPCLGDPHLVCHGPPTTRATIFGDDRTRAVFVHEADMSLVTIKAVEDPRTLNKILYVRPAANTCSFTHLVHLWEETTGTTLDKYYMPQDELAGKINQSPQPLNLQLAMLHATVAAGACDQTLVVDADAGVEATDLYPDVHYVTVRDYLHALAAATTSSSSQAAAATHNSQLIHPLRT